MSETLTGCEKTEPTSTKVPVEISTTRPKPGQITLKAPRRTKPPKHIADFDMAGRREFLNWVTCPSVRPSYRSTTLSVW